MNVKNQRAQVIYEGQMRTCDLCDSVEHMRNECPKTKTAANRLEQARRDFRNNPWQPVQLQEERESLEMTNLGTTDESKAPELPHHSHQPRLEK